MNNSDNVTAGKPKVGGAVYVAPLGTNLPTSVTESLGSAWKSLGYCSDDGVTNSNSMETDSIKAWGGDTVLALQTGKPDTFGMKLIEALNVNVLKVVYGAENISGDVSTGLTIVANSAEAEQYSWVIDMTLKGNRAKRVVIPKASVTELGDIAYTDSDAVGYEVTLTAVPDGDGNTHYEYIKGGQASAAYRVTVSAVEGGSAFANASTASSGSTVSIAASPASGYAFAGWTCADEAVGFADAEAAMTTFTMPASSVTVTANFAEEESDG